MTDGTAQLGMQIGQSAVAAGQEYVQKNVSTSYAEQCLATADMNIEPPVWRYYSIHALKAPLQRLKFICDEKATPRPFSLVP
jgi:hypothetical protein